MNKKRRGTSGREGTWWRHGQRASELLRLPAHPHPAPPSAEGYEAQSFDIAMLPSGAAIFAALAPWEAAFFVAPPGSLTGSTFACISTVLHRRQTRQMGLVFNGDCGSIPFRIGKTPKDNTRLITAAIPPPMLNLGKVAAWVALRGEATKIAKRLAAASGLMYRRETTFFHLRSTGVCAAQPAHVDEPRHWLLHATFPSLWAILVLQEGTVVHMYPGSHDIFRHRQSLVVSRSKAGPSVHVVLARGKRMLFRKDLIHAGAASTAQNDRVLFFLFNSRDTVSDEAGLVTLESIIYFMHDSLPWTKTNSSLQLPWTVRGN